MKWSWLHSSSRRFSTGVPRERHAEARVELEGGARRLAVGVLDGLRLVEDDGVPACCGERLGVEAEDGVGGQRDVGVRVDRALGAVVDGDPEAGAEAADLGGPVVDHAVRADDERAPAERAERLQRLAEAHVVGEHRAEPRVAEEREPVTPWCW